MKSITKYMAVAYFVWSMLLLSCADDKQQLLTSPRVAVSSFAQAIETKDYDKALLCTTTDSADYSLMKAWMRMMFDEQKNTTYETLSESYMQDSKAEVEVRVVSPREVDTIYIQTIKVGDQWRVNLSE